MTFLRIVIPLYLLFEHYFPGKPLRIPDQVQAFSGSCSGIARRRTAPQPNWKRNKPSRTAWHYFHGSCWPPLSVRGLSSNAARSATSDGLNRRLPD
jgi:hypothetical protein